jgi:hypothetical protein
MAATIVPSFFSINKTHSPFNNSSIKASLISEPAATLNTHCILPVTPVLLLSHRLHRFQGVLLRCF